MTDSTDPDESRFRELFAATYPRLVAYARRRSIDRAEADDVVGEVYAVAWRRRADLDLDAPPLPWLYGIAANVLRNQWRAGGRRLQLTERLEAQPQAAPAHDPADRPGAELRAALARLSFDDQEVLRLVAWEGLTHAEVAEVLDCSANAVGIRVHRARKRLQEQLEADRQHRTPQDRTGPGGTAT